MYSVSLGPNIPYPKNFQAIREGLEVVRQRFQELKKEILLLKQKLEQTEAKLQADLGKAEEKTQE